MRCSVVMHRGPYADEVRISARGVTLVWPRYSPEVRYSGRFVPWSTVRDADPDPYPPQLRLIDDRTIFVSRDHRAELADGLSRAGVPVRKRPDVWVDLLEPFLDTEYGQASRARCEGRLRSHGFTDREIHDIRRRVRTRMLAMTMLTWEWCGYSHVDVLRATSYVPGFRYLRFRKWADTIAARGEPRT